MSGNYPAGVSDNDPYFNSDPDGMDQEDESIARDIDEVLAARQQTRLRHALLDTIDEQVWGLWHPFQDVANSARLDFVAAVEKRLSR